MAVADQHAPTQPLPCAPCRGSGQVLSSLGGAAAQVRCPWCEGAGMQLAGHDAQAARRLGSPAP